MKYIVIILAIVTLASCTEQSYDQASTHSWQVNTWSTQQTTFNDNEALENLWWMFMWAALNAATSNNTTTEVHHYHETTKVVPSKSTSSSIKTTNEPLRTYKSSWTKSSSIKSEVKPTPKPVDKPKEIKSYGGGGFSKPTSSSTRSPRSSSKSPVRR
jgi:hypothetical protein